MTILPRPLLGTTTTECYRAKLSEQTQKPTVRDRSISVCSPAGPEADRVEGPMRRVFTSHIFHQRNLTARVSVYNRSFCRPYIRSSLPASRTERWFSSADAHSSESCSFHLAQWKVECSDDSVVWIAKTGLRRSDDDV
jgi:hypothetical protein